jgi:pimeloyl-ACP methyl ester carboxylesterase
VVRLAPVEQEVAVRRQYADTRHGQIHYVEAGPETAADDDGAGSTVLLLHQTPRSWDEYRDVIPLLAQHHRVVAPDTLGFGSSDRPAGPWSIELFADGVEDLVGALGLSRVVLVGHHTGGVVALEVAARRTGLVAGLVLSGVPYVDAPRREQVRQRPSIDGVPISDDGSHYQALWDKRVPFYPAERPDLLHRLVADAVRVHDRVEDGHVAVNEYRMEERIGLVRAPALVVCGELDTFSLPDVPKLLAHLPGARAATLAGVGVPSVDHDPAQFAAVVEDFLAGLGAPVR